jgi:hypothetical protein
VVDDRPVKLLKPAAAFAELEVLHRVRAVRHGLQPLEQHRAGCRSPFIGCQLTAEGLDSIIMNGLLPPTPRIRSWRKAYRRHDRSASASVARHTGSCPMLERSSSFPSAK